MKVQLAKTAGFCFGVDRAVGMVEQAVQEGKQVCTLGPIIHNHFVMERFAGQGVRQISRPEEAPLCSIRLPGITFIFHRCL